MQNVEKIIFSKKKTVFRHLMSIIYGIILIFHCVRFILPSFLAQFSTPFPSQICWKVGEEKRYLHLTDNNNKKVKSAEI